MKLTWAESGGTEDWLGAKVKGNMEELDLVGISDSLVEWLLDEASCIDAPFLTRFEPAVVETFQTSCIS